MRKWQAREASYPRAGGNSTSPGITRPRVCFADEEEVIGIDSTPPPGSPATLEHEPEVVPMEEDSGSEEEEEIPPKKAAKRASQKTGTQQARQVPVKLRSEA